MTRPRSIGRLLTAVCAAALNGTTSAQTPDVTFSTVYNSGWALSGINSVAPGRNTLVTSGNYQFAAFYDSDRYLRIARRTLDSSTWTAGRTNIRPGTTVLDDDHNTVSIAVDGDGYLHVSWGMHNIQMQYARSNAPVTSGSWGNTQAANLNVINSITGANENSVTYPEFYNVPGSKDLLLVHRNGSSGDGNEYLSRYTSSPTGNGSWTRLQPELMNGSGSSVNGYLNNLQYDSTGKLLMTWVWRYTPAFQTNTNIMYAESLDNGVTWQKQNGTSQALPINELNSQIIKSIPQNSSLINQSTMAVDNNDRPMVATWYAPQASQGEHGREYMLIWYDGTNWQTSQITNRAESRTTLVADSEVRETGRPIVLVDDDNRVIVIMRQDEDNNRIVAAYSTDRQNWDFVTLDTTNMGTYEPTYDRILWERDKRLTMYHQAVGLGSSSSTVRVMEWDVAAYFAVLPGTYWTFDGNGNWDTPTNWNGPVPNGASEVARFGGGVAPISTSPIVTIDGSKTLGTLSFNHPSSSFTLVQGAAGLLNLNRGASPALVSVIDGSHTIAVPMTLTPAGAEFNVTGGNDKLTIAATIFGSGAITKTGAGVLAFNHPGDVTVSNNFIVNNGYLQQDGAGVLTLSGTNTFAGGGISASNGTLRRASASAFGNGVNLMTSGTGRIDLDAINLTPGSLSGSGGVISDDSTTPGTTRITFDASSTVDYSGGINDGAVRQLAVTKTGGNTVKLRGPGNFSGGINLDQGFIEAYHNQALGTGSIVMNPGANNARLVLGNGVSIANPITMTTANAAVLTGSVMTTNDTSSGTASGAMTINANAANGGHFMGPRTSGLLSITGPITSGGSAQFLIVREGFVRFSGGGSYPELQIRASTTSIGADNGIASNAILDIGGNGSTGTATNLDLNGFNQTLGGLKNSVTSTNAAVVTNTGGTQKTLSLAVGAASQSFGGSIRGNLNLRMVSGRQILTKSGTTALNGVYDYTGLTIVDGGQLQLRQVAWNPVLNLAGAEINGGELIFDYTGTTTPKATILPLLAASSATDYATGKFRSTIAPSEVGLTWTDDGVSQFKVFAALYGDVNLDEKVNTLDFNILANNWGTNGPWSSGNFNHDNTIDSLDFARLVANFGKTMPAPALSLGASVPEPAILAPLALALIGLRRRRA